MAIFYSYASLPEATAFFNEFPLVPLAPKSDDFSGALKFSM